jgi:hypothetical protein
MPSRPNFVWPAREVNNIVIADCFGDPRVVGHLVLCNVGDNASAKCCCMRRLCKWIAPASIVLSMPDATWRWLRRRPSPIAASRSSAAWRRDGDLRTRNSQTPPSNSWTYFTGFEILRLAVRIPLHHSRCLHDCSAPPSRGDRCGPTLRWRGEGCFRRTLPR